MARYRFVLQPKWILSHLFVATMVVTMIGLGFWQLDRLDQRKDRNAEVSARTAQPVVGVDDLGIQPGDYDGAADLEFRRAAATGTYRADEEVIVRSRSLNGAAGSWVLTPLETGDGTVVVVNRGWIPNSGELTAVPPDFAAPDGEVTVEGLVRETETRGSIGATDPDEGTLTDLARADVARLDQQIDGDALPFWLQLQAQDPALTAADPSPVPAPPLDEGPHLSYAVQWFTFSAMTVVVYALILRRRARELEREAKEAELDRPDPDDVPTADDPRLDAPA